MGLFGCCAVLGVHASNSLHLRWDTLRALLQSFHQIALRMEYAMEPFGMLASRCGNARTTIFFNALTEALEVQTDMATAWAHAMEHAQSCDAGFAALQQEELAALYEYAAKMEEGGYQAQIKNVLLLEKQLEDIAVCAAEIYKKKGRMYRSMGILGGIAVAILLL